MTNRTEQPSRAGASRVLPFAVFALIAMCLPGAASAQWTTSGDNINNTNTGNVGVGTQTPRSKLDARSAAPKTDPGQHVVFTAGSSEPDTPFLLSVQWYGNSLLSGRRIELQTTERNIADGGNLILQPRAGNVGVGTSAPADLLHVRGTGVGTVQVQAGSVYTSYLSMWDAGGLYLSNNRDPRTGNNYNPASPGVQFILGNSGDSLRSDFIFQATSPGTVPTVNELVRFKASGNVGIGTAAPASKLHVVGDITVTGNINAKYQDVAEWVPSTQRLAAGTVVVLDPGRPNHVLASTSSYDTAVAGVISARPGLTLGEAGEGKALVATTGRVKVRVDATRGAIKVGDLLVTSDVAGVAMKSVPLDLGGVPIHRPGTLIGKALEPLAGGTGEILVLLSLQ